MFVNFISCIVYLWLIFISLLNTTYFMSSNLSSFVDKLTPVHQRLCPLFRGSLVVFLNACIAMHVKSSPLL